MRVRVHSKFRAFKLFIAGFAVVIGAGANTAAVFAFTGNGIGTEGNPYKVATCEDLQDVESDLTGYYIQTGDVDCSDSTNWNDDEGFVPIGQAGDFTGTYYGQNFTVNDIFINRSDNSAAGLFKSTSGATIKNIHLRDGSMNSGNGGYNGTLVASASSTNFSDCSSTTAITSAAQAGLVGYMNGGSVSRCWYSGDLTANDNAYTAGLVAVASGVDFTDVYTQGTLSGETYSGALVGGLDGGSLTNAYSSMDVTSAAGTYSGGLTGYMSDQGGGGNPNLTVSNVFFAGIFTESATNAGVITSFIDNTDFDGVFYDQDTCGCATELGSGSPDSGSVTAVNTDGLDADYFKNNNTSAPMASWNFSTVWQTNDSEFPTLIMGSTPTDSDGDGVDDTVENAGPNGGDANEDGVLDSAQSNVATAANATTGDDITLASGQNCGTIDSISPKTESQLSNADGSFEYPLGLLDFTLTCNTQGATTAVTQYIVSDLLPSEVTIRKIVNGVYSTISSASVVQQQTDGQNVLKVSYSITDGGELDADGTANSSISDPVGIGVASDSLAETGQSLQTYLLIGFCLIAISATSITYSLRRQHANRQN
jgi:hypothetical protein